MQLSRFRPTRAALAAVLFLACFAPRLPGQIDLNEDGLPDIWALKYDAAGLVATDDADGDGQTNAQEGVAGTNPFQPEEVIKVASIGTNTEEVYLTFQTVGGKRYRVQSAAELESATWADVGSLLTPDGSNSLTATVAAGGGQKFYRVRVLDTDSDGDGVNDWEELQAGFDPENSHSNGPGSEDDLTAIRNALVAPNIITITASPEPVAEPADATESTVPGVFTIQRSGGLVAITVNLTVGGDATAGSDYVAIPESVRLGMGVKSATVMLAPLPDTVIESPETVILTVSPAASYTPGSAAVSTVMIHDYVTPNGDGAFARYWNGTAETIDDYATAFPAGAPTISRVEEKIDNSWDDSATAGVGSPGMGVNSDYFVSRYTAEILPRYSGVHTFTGEVNTAGRLVVNGQVVFDDWGGNPGSRSGTIDLQAGQRVPIVFEHMARTGEAWARLRWASADQPDEIIPQNRLFSNPPPQIISNLQVLLLKNSPLFTHQIAASGSPTSYGAANLPPGWTFDTATGLLSGVPTQEGTWDIPITATNSAGSGSAILRITVIQTDGSITRDVWTGVAGTSIESIPLATTPTSTEPVMTLEGPRDEADDYGARLRGYLTAPSTGVYKFWLAASDTAELWISNDDERVNSIRRAVATGPAAWRDWAAAGKSPLLWLEAGQRYFVEVRHKAGVGVDHLSVGWLKPNPAVVDPDNAAAPDEVVPSYALSEYVAPPVNTGGGTLYTTSLNAGFGVITNGSGSASLRLSADESEAILAFSYANLTSAVGPKHIHSDAHGGAMIFDIDATMPNPDGSYTWSIVDVGAILAPAIVNAIKNGEAWLDIHTANHPNGEIRGNFHRTAASETFTPPPLETWNDPNSASNPESALHRDGAARFLIQATFGPSEADIAVVQALGFEGWIDQQMNPALTPVGHHFPEVYANRNQTDGLSDAYNGNLNFNTWWRRAVTSPDQLRQRVAFALSEILVVSEDGPLDDRADALSNYYDVLLDDAFGNFLPLLRSVTLHPAMGRYLDMLNNRKPNFELGRIPNENYAREIQQLFSIGLNRLHPDGSLVLNSKGHLIPTYTQNEVIGFAHVFTGWTYHYTDVLNGPDPANYRTSNTATSNWINPMQPVPLEHFTGRKRLLDNVVLRGLPVLGGAPLDAYASHSATQSTDPEYQQLAQVELDATLRALFNHSNTGPFICRQLIQRLVTGTPSRGYLHRIVQAFDGERDVHGVATGTRGELKDVIKAILLDKEARALSESTRPGFGKQREPVVRVAAVARAFPGPAPLTGTYTQAGSLITITTNGNHLYLTGHLVPIEFADASSGDAGHPVDAIYPISLVNATTFRVRTKSFEGPVSFEQDGAATKFSASGDGFYPFVNDTVHVEYLSGTPTQPQNGTAVVDYQTGDKSNIYLGAPGALRATYLQDAGSSDLVCTTRTTADFDGSPVTHNYTLGQNICVRDLSASGISGTYTITAATPDSFTVTAADTSARGGSALVVDAASALPPITGTANITRTIGAEFSTRSGSVRIGYGNWIINETGTDLNQTPLRSPTVFNFFVPDYRFPGALGQAGLTTPEFQLTSETTVIRQANFLYNGLFNDGLGQTGLASFKSGARNIFVDLRPWMGTGPGGLPWLHNDNLNALIDELNTRLMAGQLPEPAMTIIRNYVATLGYTAPSITQLRDRIRAVVHLLVTSPDFTIQK